MGQLVARAERGATMGLSATTVTAMDGLVLLCGRFNDAVFGVISHLLRRPFTFWRFVQIVAPGLTANGGALEYAVCRVGLCLFTSPFAFAFGAHGVTPALAAWLVRAPLQEETGDRKGCKECWSSNQWLMHNKVSQIFIKKSEVLSVIFQARLRASTSATAKCIERQCASLCNS